MRTPQIAAGLHHNEMCGSCSVLAVLHMDPGAAQPGGCRRQWSCCGLPDATLIGDPGMLRHPCSAYQPLSGGSKASISWAWGAPGERGGGGGVGSHNLQYTRSLQEQP